MTNMRLNPDNGHPIARGIISAFCHGYTIDQAAALNGIDTDAAQVIMLMVMSDAGMIDTITEEWIDEK